ncbi:MAG: hypothetical protein ACO1TE_20715 [Prosthecobacter sp.]
MKHPIYTLLTLLSCGYLIAANAMGWSFLQSSANRSAYQSTSYRYRSSMHSSGSGGGWFSGMFHK